MEDDKYKLFLQDLVNLLKENLEDSFEEIAESNKEDSEYIKGKVFAFYTVLDLTKSQANAFQIPLGEIELEDYNLELFLSKT